MDYEHSTQRARWTQFEGLELENGTEQLGPGHVDARKKGLIVRTCAHKVYQIGTLQRYSKNVVLTAMAYVRRVFADENALKEHPDVSLMIVTALYLAGKVEEVPPAPGVHELNQRGLDMDALGKCVQNDTRPAEVWKKDAIRNEMKLLVGLNFDLLCFHPLRPANGYWEHMKRQKRVNGMDASQEKALQDAIWARSVGCYLVDDLIFIYPPSFLGAVVVYSAVKSLQSMPDPAKQRTLDDLLQVFEETCSDDQAKLLIRPQLLQVVEQLDRGMQPDRDKEAAIAYKEFVKRGR